MMKKYLFWLFFVQVFCLSAQTPPTTTPQEGMIRYLVTHNWTKKMAAVDYISKQQREKLSYMFSNRSEWKSYCDMYFSPTKSKYFDSEERAQKDDEGYSWKREMFFIQRDFEKNRTFEGFEMLGKKYVLEDDLQPQAWKIQSDLKEVAGHICMKALWEDTIKHQKVVAWFAQDIPLSMGPEKFCGLPGLILEVDVNDGGMTISAETIMAQKLTKEFDIPQKLKGKKITNADFEKMLKAHIEEKRKAEEPPFWGIRY